MLTSRINITLACILSAIAGYIDGVGFLHLGGLFVSFMSGNSTRLGIGLAQENLPLVGEAISLIALFVAGAGIGTLIVHGSGRYAQVVLLVSEAALLAGGAFAYEMNHSTLAVGAIVLAMGMENAVFQAAGGAGLALTYVTGALVKVGQTIGSAFVGGPRWAFVPHLLLWASLSSGAMLGAISYFRFNLSAIWFAAAALLLLASVLALRAVLYKN